MKKSEIEKNLETLMACRYCPMCRHACTSGILTNLESDFPRGRALILYQIYKGVATYDADLVNSIYNCILCGCCWANCEGGYRMPDLIKAARVDIVNEGKEPEIVKEIKSSLVENENPWGIKKENSFTLSSHLSSHNSLLSFDPSNKISRGETENPRGKNCQTGVQKIQDGFRVLYYLGSSVNFLNHEIAKAAIRIFRKLNLPFYILRDEPTEGKLLMLLGYIEDAKKKAEGLYKKICQEIKSSINTIVTSDPLSYDAFKNDYPQWGIGFEPEISVYHISEFLRILMKKQELILGKDTETLTLVDSEYLGRFNGVFEPAREVIKSANENFVEMRFNRKNSLATGEAAIVFNGKRFFLGDKLGEKICEEAKSVKAKKVITLSPQAKNNLHLCTDFKVMDIAEYIDKLII